VKITHPTIPILATALFGAALLAACDTAESDWQKAQALNTEAAFQDFLTHHPSGAHSQEAHERIQALEDDQAWADAQKAGTADGYQGYLTKEPAGKHADEAHTQITALTRAADWKSAQATNTEQSLQDFIQKYSQGAEVDQAKAQLQKLQNEKYRVQLGSFHDDQAAEKARADLQTKFGNDLHDIVVIPPSGSSKTHEVGSGPMTEEDAKAVCTKLKKAHQHCEVVKR
jgi:outer membrane protein assembly factor BamD (BamD/ComL family)